MSDSPFGEQDVNLPVEPEMTDDWFDTSAREPDLPEGEMFFIIMKYTAHPSKDPNSNSFGYDFSFKPYMLEDGTRVSLVQGSKDLNKYMYMGKVGADGMLYDSANAGFTKAFFASIGIGRGEGKVALNQENVRGTVVRGKVIWKKLLSRNENPNTGKVPEAIDENDPFTYFVVANVADGSLRGVRDDDGSIKHVNVASIA